ncbi:MAG: hypothetical protein LUE23_04515 [Lachnospiraceae bacterium]|nr:hypothetical protein [Lachnospiraceae bacterium]
MPDLYYGISFQGRLPGGLILVLGKMWEMQMEDGGGYELNGNIETIADETIPSAVAAQSIFKLSGGLPTLTFDFSSDDLPSYFMFIADSNSTNLPSSMSSNQLLVITFYPYNQR